VAKLRISPARPAGSFRRATAAALAVSLLVAAAPAAAATETAVLAGGCFWGTEAVFEHVKGVQKVVSGFAGGTKGGFGRPVSERTGFAEAVRISFDPARVSYEQLLQIFMMVAHDPTQVDRQGPDIGPRYRSAIFAQNAQQKQVARRVLDQMRASGHFRRPIATRLESGGFDVAEEAHQDYVRKHPASNYVVVNDLPKLAKLKRRYPQFWSD
jgi:peptide-methionine (S)-S-oxide reductase